MLLMRAAAESEGGEVLRKCPARDEELFVGVLQRATRQEGPPEDQGRGELQLFSLSLNQSIIWKVSCSISETICQ